jgi:hypothetical protein
MGHLARTSPPPAAPGHRRGAAMADKESGPEQAAVEQPKTEQAKTEQLKTQVTGVDGIIKAGPANYFKGLSNSGGKLILTDTQLIFKPGRLNFRRSIEAIAVKEIVAVERRNTLGVVPNGFGVILRDGKAHRFVVYGREEWIEAVVKVRSKISPPKKMS